MMRDPEGYIQTPILDNREARKDDAMIHCALLHLAKYFGMFSQTVIPFKELERLERLLEKYKPVELRHDDEK